MHQRAQYDLYTHRAGIQTVYTRLSTWHTARQKEVQSLLIGVMEIGGTSIDHRTFYNNQAVLIIAFYEDHSIE